MRRSIPAFHALRSSLHGGLSRPLRACQSGVAMVEFAVALPVLLTLASGCYVLSDMIACQRKVTQATEQLTDIVARSSAVGQGDVAGILAASAQVLAPYAGAKAAITVSEVQISSGGKASVLWSQSLNGAALDSGSVVALPAGVSPNCGVMILGQVNYAYVPTMAFGSGLFGPGGAVPLSDSLAMSPRYGPQVSLDGVSSTVPACS